MIRVFFKNNSVCGQNIGPQTFTSLLLFFCLIMLPQTGQSQQTLTSVRSGNWNDCATWGGNNNPDHGDAVTIAVGHVVTIPTGTNFEVGTVNFAAASSELRFTDGSTVLRYTNTDRGYTAPSCCSTTAPTVNINYNAGGGTSVTWDTNNNSPVFRDRNGNFTMIGDFVVPTLPAGATFVRWELIANPADLQFFSTSSTTGQTFTVTFTYPPGSFGSVICTVRLHYTYQESLNCPVINTNVSFNTVTWRTI